MKKFTEKGIVQKIILLIVIILLIEFSIPIKVQAAFWDDWEMPTLEDIVSGAAQCVAALGDLVMSALNNFMLGTAGFGSAMITQEANRGSWFFQTDGVEANGGVEEGEDVTITETEAEEEEVEENGKTTKKTVTKTITYVSSEYLDEEPMLLGSSGWEIPNLLYSPENIFGNKIAMLDVNFLNPNDYTSVVESGRGQSTAEKKTQPISSSLKNTISNWYKAFRNIAIVALLSILVYLGIRILISSTAEDKAKYKERIKDWIVALCLVFLMHFIMSATIMMVNQINSLFNNINNDIYIKVEGGELFKTNLMGQVRFLAQAQSGENAWAYTIMYWGLIVFTIMFTFQYLKRVLYIAFYTMISPLVAITYPIDKIGDGKSQAFNMWFKEYMMNMLLQPIHLILYTMLISSAISLSLENPLFGLVALGFLIPAEQFIKKLFGLNPEADKGFGSFAGGAATMAGVQGLAKLLKSGGSGKSGKQSGGKGQNDGTDGEDEGYQIPTRTTNNPLAALGGATTSGENAEPREGEDSDENDSTNQDDGMQWHRNAFGDNAQAYYNPHTGEYDENYNPQSDFGEDDIYNDGLTAEERHNNAFGDKSSAYYNPWTGKYDENYDPSKDEFFASQNSEQEGLETESPLSGQSYTEKIPDGHIEPTDEQTRQYNQQLINSGAKDSIGRKIIKGVKKVGHSPVGRGVKRFVRGPVRYTAKGALKAARFAANAGVGLAGATLGASAGVVAGITSGQGLGAAVKNGITGATALGAASAVAASKVPGPTGIVSGAAGLVKGGIQKVRDTDRKWAEEKARDLEITKGKEAAEEFRVKRARELAKSDKQYKEKYKEIARKMNAENPGADLSYKQIRDRAFDYENRNITDEKQLQKLLSMEYKHDKNAFTEGKSSAYHDGLVAVAGFAKDNNFDKSYTYDKKKMENMDNALDNLDGANDATKDQFKKMFYEMHDAKYPKSPRGNTRTAQNSDANNGNSGSSNA